MYKIMANSLWMVLFLWTSLTLLATNEVQAQAISQEAGARVDFEKRQARFQILMQKVKEKGKVSIIVRFDPGGVLRMPASKESMALPLAVLSKAQEDERVRVIGDAHNVLLNNLKGRGEVSIVKKMRYSPHLAMTVDIMTLEALREDPHVMDIYEDKLAYIHLAQSIPFIQADELWSNGYTGDGQTIAILDTGVDKTHPFLDGKVISEACYSTTNSTYGSSSVCSGGVSATTASGSGINCPVSNYGCDHGTHVAGITAGKDPGGVGFNGVAKDAKLIAIQVFSRFTSGCPTGWSSCVRSYTSDQLLALERVYALRNTYNIASVNMSLGGGQYYSYCDDDPRKTIIDNLKSVGIATIISSGNEDYRDSMGSPACISSAVSVGATYDNQDSITDYSNIAPFISLLAPGSVITSSVPGGGYEGFNGTSMAAPHVAGAWALLKEQNPSALVDFILNHLKQTGVTVNDTRPDGSVTGMKRINLGAAVPPAISLGEAVDNESLQWSSSGSGQWRGQTAVSFYGGDSAQSGQISDNQMSALETAVVGPGSLTFYWKVSSEQNYDFLRFNVDGTEQFAISGAVDWQQKTVSIPGGQHSLSWSYTKDSSVSAGTDAAWVDKVVFTPSTNYLLTVTKTGQGTVTSDPTGIDCGSDCSESYVSGTNVTLIATPSADYIFAGWSGACSGTGSCALSMTSARDVTATFTASQLSLGEALDNTALNWSSSGNVGWNAQTTISFFDGDAVQSGPLDNDQASHLQTTVTGPGTLTFYWKVSSEEGYDFLAFTDGSDQLQISGEVDWQRQTVSIASGQHTLSWSYIKDVSVDVGTDAGWVDKVEYTPSGGTSYMLTVTKIGQGAVTSEPTGINCGADCGENYVSGTIVTLIATPSAGYAFTGWSGECNGTGSCVVAMNAAKNVNATFTAGQLTLAEALDNTTLPWSSSGNAGWSGQTTVSFFGGDAAQSGVIANDQMSNMETTVTGPGTLTFYWKVSSEQDYDFLRFKIDGIEQFAISGAVDWQQRTVSVPSGHHTLGWFYTKDYSVSEGADTGWVDKVIYTSTGNTNFLLTVTKTGQGTVTSNPAGINCGTDCRQDYSQGSSVTLTAIPLSGFDFIGWGGDCSGTGSCAVLMSANKNVSAMFTGFDPSVPLNFLQQRSLDSKQQQMFMKLLPSVVRDSNNNGVPDIQE